MKPTFKIMAIAIASLLIPSISFAQCPDQLLWTNGSNLWAYRAIDCSGEFCDTATDKVMIFSSELNSTGCAKEDEKCSCRAAEAKPIEGGAAIAPDQPIQNRGCQTLDSFVVKIADDYIQCVEFRYIPDQRNVDDFGQAIARNMRLSFKLSGEPKEGNSNMLVDDNAKVANNAVERMIGDIKVSYPMMASGVQTLEKMVVREAPVVQQQSTPPADAESKPADERPGPDDDDDETSP